MRALWSRARGSTITCRCVQCTSGSSAIIRRVGAVHIKGSWAVGTLPTSTFSYTAIFVAGLAIDGSAKRKRNRQWERAFSSLRETPDVEEDVHHELVQPPTEQVRNPEDVGEPHAETRGVERDYEVVHKRFEPIDQVVPAESQSLYPPGYIPIDDVFPEGVDWTTLFLIAGEEITQGMRQVESHLDYVTDTYYDLLAIDCTLPLAQLPPWPANTGQALIRHYLPPQSLWSAGSVRSKALRRKQTWKKLMIQELSIGMFIYSLLEPARRLSLSENHRSQLAPSIRDILNFGDLEVLQLRADMLAGIVRLQETPVQLDEEDVYSVRELINQQLPYARPQYFQDVGGYHHRIRRSMNTAIMDILMAEVPLNSTHVATALGKVAHNLLVSSAPPDVQTFNILLAGLKRWSLPGLVNEAIKALEKCKIRPNELTCVEILEHYIGSNRPHDFGRFVKRIRGIGDALMLAKPNITINEVAKDRLVKVEKDGEVKVYQKLPPTPLVFNSIMAGVLKFAGLDRALEIYYEMKAEGWGLDITGLTRLLADCLPRSDWDSGRYIWEEIATIKAAAEPSLTAEAYSTMLSLCTVTGNTAAFNQILSEVTYWSKQLRKTGFEGRGTTTKEVIEAATQLTRRFKKEHSVTAAPAWSADNLLIALSGPLDEETFPSNPVPVEPAQYLEAEPMDTPALTEHANSEIPDPWSAWLECELGRREVSPGPQIPKTIKPTFQPLGAERMDTPADLGTPDPWSVWLEGPLGQKKTSFAAQAFEKAKPTVPTPEVAIAAKLQQSAEQRDSALQTDPWAAFLEGEWIGKTDSQMKSKNKHVKKPRT